MLEVHRKQVTLKHCRCCARMCVCVLARCWGYFLGPKDCSSSIASPRSATSSYHPQQRWTAMETVTRLHSLLRAAHPNQNVIPQALQRASIVLVCSFTMRSPVQFASLSLPDVWNYEREAG
eukprot:1242630-Amphidinium_carterae.2